MDKKEFWRLTEKIDRAATESDDLESAMAPLRLALSELTVRKIREYEEVLAKMLYLLDGETYANHAGDAGRSADGFLYVRCHVVACGRRIFEDVLAHPDSMTAHADKWCEELLYVCAEAWAAKTGSDIDEWDVDTRFNYETGSNSDAWPAVVPAQKIPVQKADLFDFRLDQAVGHAGHAFKNKQYENVVKLLERHEKSLSPKQLKMLQFSRTACSLPE